MWTCKQRLIGYCAGTFVMGGVKGGVKGGVNITINLNFAPKLSGEGTGDYSPPGRDASIFRFLGNTRNMRTFHSAA